MKYKIFSGTLDGRFFVISIFDDKKAIFPMEAGLKRFFEAYETSKLKEKIKKEADQGYFSMSSSNSSGCKRG